MLLNVLREGFGAGGMLGPKAAIPLGVVLGEAGFHLRFAAERHWIGS